MANLLLCFFAVWIASSCPAFAGTRIAISEDGNYHDTDDYDSAAISVAEMAEKGRAGDVVYWGYCDHYWRSVSSRETIMHDSVVKTAAMWGGFSSAQFFNVAQQHAQAVAALATAINASDWGHNLVILEQGPAQVIGEAIAASHPSARPYVTVESHSRWNDNHAVDCGAAEGLKQPRYSYSQFAAMGVKTVHIQDQNAGLNKPYSDYYWMRDSTDPNLQWLWQRGRLAGKSTYDCSDAGLTYYALTGDPSATPTKLKGLVTQ